MFDIHGRLTNVDVRPSTNPIRENSRSKLQKSCGEEIQNILPCEIILEEFNIPGSLLKIDFFLPRRKIAIECDGDQHDKFNPFFHGDKNLSQSYVKQKVNDIKKEEWCEMNGISLFRVKSPSQIIDILS